MPRPSLTAGAALVSLLVFGAGLRAQLPLEPRQDSGQGVTAAYEGWFKNADGSFSLLIGYFNRNQKQTLDIPAGPNNRIEPGGPDQGQPTHFMPRRQWGVFTVRVPADFGDRKLTWTIVANKHTTSVAMGLHPDYQVEPLRDAAEGNTPPIVRLEPGGRTFQGPPLGIALAMTTATATPLTLTLWATDDGKVNSGQRETDSPITVSWSKFRGPGDVSFANPRPPVDKADGRTTTPATFGAAGEYILRGQVNDVSGEGGGGFQCCWTNVHVKVTVTP